MYTLQIASAIKNRTVNELIDFIFENYYNRIEFAKESSYDSMKYVKKKHLSLFATKLIEKIPDSNNIKEYYNSYLKKKKIENRRKIKKNYSGAKSYRKQKYC